jgi:hypothetical protein
MTKRALIDEILARNPSAEAAFLACFPEEDLREYLHHLEMLSSPRMTGDASRYEKYFSGSADESDEVPGRYIGEAGSPDGKQALQVSPTAEDRRITPRRPHAPAESLGR